MHCFGIDLSKLEEKTHAIIYKEVDGVPSTVYVSRDKGSIPIPLGCTEIALPIRIFTDGYWFAALFPSPSKIINADPARLFRCIAGFFPHLRKLKVTVSPVSPGCFHADEDGNYRLVIPECSLHYDATPDDIAAFQKELAYPLPENERLMHAIEHD